MKAVLVEGNLNKWIWTLSWPMLIGFISLSSVPLVDVMLVSELGSLHRAMISLILPLTLIAMGLPVGLNIALSSLLAGYIGKQQSQKIGPLFTFGVTCAFFMALLIAVFVTCFDEAIYRFLGVVDQEGLDLLSSYFIPWIWGWCPLVAVVSINSIFRAQGLARPISSIMFFAAIFHILADLFFIRGWGTFGRLGMAGAGWAEVVTGIGTIIYSFFWQKRLSMLKYWKWQKPENSEIYRLFKQALGASFAYILPVTAQMLTQHYLVRIDITALSVYGAITRLEVVGTMPVMAVSSALTPIIAQNRGAKRFERCWKAILRGILYAGFLGVFYVLLLHCFQDYAAYIFNIQAHEKQLFKSMLNILLPSWLLWAVALVPLGSFYGFERSIWVLKVGFVRLFILFFLLQTSALESLEIVQKVNLSQLVYTCAVAIGVYKIFSLCQARDDPKEVEP
jgi:Na+-driven multidrug efflux pump